MKIKRKAVVGDQDGRARPTGNKAFVVVIARIPCRRGTMPLSLPDGKRPGRDRAEIPPWYVPSVMKSRADSRTISVGRATARPLISRRRCSGRGAARKRKAEISRESGFEQPGLAKAAKDGRCSMAWTGRMEFRAGTLTSRLPLTLLKLFATRGRRQSQKIPPARVDSDPTRSSPSPKRWRKGAVRAASGFGGNGYECGRSRE